MLFDLLQQPPLFQKSATMFWDEEHISRHLLAAHLNPDFEGASRSPKTIDASVEWIAGLAPADKFPRLLDLGCGPGLYAERLYDRGYAVTGVDLSQRSIAYAKKHAEETGRYICYQYLNYLELDYKAAFEAAILIYCDFGALSPEDGAELLRRIHRALTPGGVVILDVFSMRQYEAFTEKREWEYHPDGGFWSPSPYHALQANQVYPPHATLEQTVVVTSEKTVAYYIWNRYFTPETLRLEAEAAGFADVLLFADATGAALHPESRTIALVARKWGGLPAQFAAPQRRVQRGVGGTGKPLQPP